MGKFFKLQWHKFTLYAGLPEMRLSWLFLPILIVVSVIDIFNLPPNWMITSIGALFLLGVVVLVNNLRLARSNLEIKIERNELTSIITNLRDGIVAYDPNFKIVVFNKASSEIFGVRAEDVVGQYFSPDKAQAGNLKIMAQVIFPSLAPIVVRRSEPGAYPQVVDISFDEPKMELRVSTDKIIDSAGHLLGFVKVIHDRTRELELFQSKTEFIGVAAHQLRTPLTAVNWIFESLVKEQLSDSAKEMVNEGISAAGKALKTVNDLLDVSKIEEGRFGYQFQNVNIVAFLEDILSQAMIVAKERGVQIFWDKPADLSIIVMIDSQKLGMAISNIIDNAVNYNVKNGEVIVKLERVNDKPYILISIKDTGMGIPKDEIGKIFTKFFRAENAVKYRTEGTGMGLYIAKNIVRRHGGEISVESEVDRGTTFYVTLPTDPKLVPAKEIIYGEE